jgi:hypothetical protein
VELLVREPVAWVADAADPPGSTPYLLTDIEGQFYRPRKILSSHQALPLIQGVRVAAIEQGDILHRQDVREALALLQTARFSSDLPFTIRRIDIHRGYALEVTTSDDTLILFPMGEYAAQISRLRRLIDHTHSTGRNLAEVNLIPQRNTPVRFLMAQRTEADLFSDLLDTPIEEPLQEEATPPVRPALPVLPALPVSTPSDISTSSTSSTSSE